MAMNDREDFLRIEDLKVSFPIYKGVIFRRRVGSINAVNGVSFSIRRGETFGLVGESGCGKSTTALALLRLNVPATGRVIFEGRDINSMGAGDLRRPILA
jgi:oligopeptide transport system ATP-binding protein